MTVKELLKCKDFDAVEVYRSLEGRKSFHTDQIRDVSYYYSNEEVFYFQIMDEEDYKNTILANTCESADFESWYDDKNAKVLCILIK